MAVLIIRFGDEIMYYFIVNISGGSGKVKKTWVRVREELKRRNVLYKAFRTKSPEHAKVLAGKISELEDGDIRMVVVGGDGTINEVLNGIKAFDRITFSVIPSGSANDFARGLGISKDPVEALDGILDETKVCHKIDVGCVTTSKEKRLFGISSGIGLDAIVCKKALDSRLKKALNKLNLGSFTYIMLTVISLFTMKHMDTEIEVFDENDGQNNEDKKYSMTKIIRLKKMIFAAFMNVKAEGGGVPMAPDAKYDDGKISVCIASDISKLSAFIKLPVLVMAKHEKLKGFRLFEASKLVVKTKAPAVIHADGEYIGDETQIVIECLPQILNLKK